MAMEKNAATQIKINGTANGTTTSSSTAVGVLVANENCYVTQTPTTLLESLPYYYGCITREDAEWILYDEGCPDGMYLLRESGTDFVLSLCHHQSVLHYRINKLPSGDVVLQGLPNQTFPSPMELIDAVDGLACKPTIPLKAMFGKCLPPTHWKLDEESIREQLIQRAQNWGMSNDEMREMIDCDLHFQPTLSPLIRSLINKSMHEIQPWYHYRLSRNEAERRIESSGHLDGKFLVRERDESSYAICLSHDSRVKHYRIDILPSGNFAIQDGPKFESLIALISHYTIFSGGLWCMLDEGCPRPQEMIRQYAEQSNAQMSMVQMNNHPHHLHPHPHLLNDHHHHHLHNHNHNHPNLDPYQVQNNNDHHHPMVWAIHRGHDPLEFNEKCKACLQLFPTNRHRNRRVSTPTNLKLKEWFTTINHKWARIKRQVILHHQRQQPLINEDNYGTTTTTNEMACCHVSKIKNASKAKNLKELLNGRNEPYRFNLQSTNLPFQCKCFNNNNNNSTFNNNHNNNNNNHHHHHHHHHRYMNGYGTSRYAYRKQQFGRWHEEPAFGSRYAFDNEPFRQANSVTNTPNSKPNNRLTMAQNNDNNNMNLSDNNNDNNNVNNGKLTTAAAATGTGTGTATDKIIDKLNGDGGDGDPDENLHQPDESEMFGANRPALIKSSSIDTIAAFFNDPIEEIRRLHFRPMMDEPNPTTGLFCSSTMRNSNDLARTNRPFVDPELLQLRTTCNKENGVNNKLLLQRTNSFDGMTNNNSVNLVNHCTSCNCSDWLLDFDIDCNDPFQSLPETDLAKNNCLNLNFNDDEVAMKELTNVFNNASAASATAKALSQGSGGCGGVGGGPFLMNGFSKDSEENKLNGFPNGQPSPSSSLFGKGSAVNSADLKTLTTTTKNQEPRPRRRATSQTRTSFVNLNGPLNSGEDELVNKDNIIIDNNKNHHHLNKTTMPVLSGTTSSSSSHSGSSSSMSISSSGGNSSTGSGGGGVGVRVHFGGSNRSFGTASTMTMKSLKQQQQQSDNVDQKKSNNNNNNGGGQTIKNGHLSFHSTSLHLNSDLMDSNFFSRNVKCDDINHSNSSSSTSSSPSSMSLTTTMASAKTNITTATFSTNNNNNNLLNDKMPPSATVSDSLNSIGDNGIIGTNEQQQCSVKPPPSSSSTKISNRLPIIDLLKEFDVCFNNQDNIDDDSSTLTDNSSHSSNCKRDNDTTTTTDDCPKNCPRSSNDANSNINHKSSSSSSYHHSSLPPPTISPPPPPTSMCSMISEQWPNGTAIAIDSPPSSSTPTKAANQQQQQQVPSGCNGNRNDVTIADAHRPTTATTGTTTTTTEQCLKDIELICLNEVIEEVQETIQKCKRGPICFDPRCITLKRRIGNGYFGDVFLASIPSLHISTNINLAVKMLKSHAVPQQKAEILREAQTMAKLDHRHIVRLIGVCENDPFMLVMELAPLGPLNKYLQNYGQNMSDEDVLKLMLQVAKAMQYLEDMNYVHRDLAARNILLVNEKFAKVSDFGMSRALGQGKDYYKARSASKWPLKWYAPECIYYYKFSSKSDVWSFGVALWEAMSRGEMPYQGMDGQDILRMFNENRRLPKPEHCSVIIYQIMWSCWQFKPEDRLNFANITEQLTHYLGGK